VKFRLSQTLIPLKDPHGEQSLFVCHRALAVLIGEKRYQSTIVSSFGNPHNFAMKSLKAKNESEHLFLSVVDDDASMRESLPDLISTFGFAAQAFASAEEFLTSGSAEETSCLILDVSMPGMSGPELQQVLRRRGDDIPIIFITGQKDETIRARVLEQGASGFLVKPFSDAALIAAIQSALQSAEPPGNL
jgi:CheY-like chemotaxis protein